MDGSFNPFLSIWTQPRRTIRHIVATDPNLYVVPLVYVSAFFQALEQASDRGLGDTITVPGVFLLAALVSFIAIPVLNVGARFARWTGSMVGGTGSREAVRAAIAWSTVPSTAWACALWPVQLALFGPALFGESPPQLDGIGPQVAVMVLGAVFSVWSSVVALKCFAEVHGISTGRAVAAGLVGVAVVVVPVVVILAAIVLIARAG
jgi:hypothetical protein